MKKIIPLLGVAAILSLCACNKESKDTLDGKVYTNDPGKLSGKPKVLCLVIDGVRGETMRSLKPAVIWSMRDSAVFSWSGIGDVSGADGATWADMLTGVTGKQHGVIGDDYTKADLVNHPVFTKYLKDAGVLSRSAAFCAAAPLSQQLIGNSMDVNKVFTSDTDVKNAVINELGNDSATIVFAEFNQVNAAGKQYGYDESIPQYVNAIQDADNKVGEIMNALRARKNYADENWLVIVTSNHGGTWPVAPQDADGTPFTNPVQNTFTLFFNPRFESQVIVRPENIRVAYEGSTVRLFGPPDSYVRAEIADGDFYNIQGRNMTFEAKVKFNKGPNGNYTFSYPPFFGKCTQRSSANPGWAFFRNGSNISFYVADGTTKAEVGSGNFKDGDWHNITGTVEINGNTVNTALFIDGDNKVTGSIVNANINGFKTDRNTILGYFEAVFTDQYVDMYMTDVRIFNTVVSDETIKLWAPRTYVNRAHPNYANLIGYWPCTDGKGAVFTDQSPSKKNLSLKGKYTWSSFSDLSGYLFPVIPNQEKYVPNPADIPFVILGWMKVPVQADWNLEGKAWPANYRDFPIPANK
ncbi:type I phosphodiesterase/nucleotide pyrophosphatase [Chitinophaga niastensis]|uniref:Type I phosphodiesterase/nucleotide pyrophosphatase n=1 Tax=Chitinophaga niastensis TaxID=536980 RepID=A0A2P8HJ62_CHINA|nr:DUF4983 domain-containing protein [Chitinophaga niastensis]PSL46248.1 type I phosphodiesterase/nucleotide pyrophosphatase [Chitinophaga niastensis]